MKVNSFFHAFITFVFLVVLFLPSGALAQGERRLIREGNKLYHKQQFNESELSYRRALERDDDSPQARFNLGNSLYKQERYDEATGYFSELAGEIEDPVNRSKVFHNMGNSLLMSQQLNESIEAYKEALRNNPADSETRYNLALAQKLLDEQQQQDEQDEDQQEDEEEQEEDEQDQEEDEEQSDDQQDEEDETGEEDQDEQDEQNQDEQDEQDQQDQQQDDQQDDQQDQDQTPQQQQDQISPEDALRMLEAAGREEQEVQEKVMENKASKQQPATGRNW